MSKKQYQLADLIAMEQKARKSHKERHWNEFLKGVAEYVERHKKCAAKGE